MAVFPTPNPIYQPAIRQIAAIFGFYLQNNLILLVITTQDHLYNNGLFVRFQIPLENAAQQLNGLFSEITVVTPTAFTMTFPAFQFDPFVVPVPQLQAPLVIPIAENVLLLNSAERNVLP